MSDENKQISSKESATSTRHDGAHVLMQDGPGRQAHAEVNTQVQMPALTATPAPAAAPVEGPGSSAAPASGRGFLGLLQAKQEPSEHPPKKRRTSGPRAQELQPKPAQATRGRACNIEWSMALGSFQFNAWSTIRMGAEQQFPTEDDGSFGPLLRQGRRLELRWAVEAKKSRARPGTASAQVGAETGTIRFDACGQEVGRFPADVNKTLVPLLARRLIDVEVVVGADPPRALTLGTDLPVVVRVSLRSVALRTPGQIDAKPSSEADNVGKSKSKGQNQKAAADSVCWHGCSGPEWSGAFTKVHKEEADKEIQRTSTGMLLEKCSTQRTLFRETQSLSLWARQETCHRRPLPSHPARIQTLKLACFGT